MAGKSRPNILWYCTDQQRWDTIGALGNSYINTPVLDQLCSEGVAFRRGAFCQSPICTPSRATFLTGRYPAAHQVHRNGNANFPSNEVLVTRILAEAGYDCGLVGKLHLSSIKNRETHPDDGYRFVSYNASPNQSYPSGDDYAGWLREEKGVVVETLRENVKQYCGAGFPEEYHQTTWCTEMAIRFIMERRDGPWLLSVNPFDPHPPFDPPQSYLERYDPAKIPPPLFRQSDIAHQKKFRNIDQQFTDAIDPTRSQPITEGAPQHSRGQKTYNVPETFDGRAVKAAYYAMVEQIDAQFGRILNVLLATGQVENTLIVFMSDHGELLGDHGLICKGCRFYDGLVRVPLIFAWPGRIRNNLMSDALVELVDVAPTLLDAAGLELPQYMQGRSLMPLLTGVSNGHVHKSHVISEYYDALALPDRSHGSMYYDGRYKSIVYHGHQLGELYDHEIDPGEFDDIWGRSEYSLLRCDIMQKHFDALMATIGVGVERIAGY